MKPLLFILIAFTAFFSTSYWYVGTASICPVPIYYSVGDIDERFSINKEELKVVLLEAESVWEKTSGRDLFVYKEDSPFKVNLIYDERQQLASTEEEWRLRLDIQEKESHQAIEKVKVEAAAYDVLQLKYTTERDKYDAQLAAYNEKVESYNKKGGAPAPVFAELQKEQRELSAFINRLVALEKELNDKADNINYLGEVGNQLIENYNSEVLKYNEIYGDIDLYTQGDFQRDRINIYKFSNKEELTKVIIHEFGHSLGIGHVEGEESIMYYLMAKQPSPMVPTVDDREALIAICGDGTGISYEARRIIRTVLTYL